LLLNYYVDIGGLCVKMKTNLLIMILALSIMFGFIIGLCVGIESGERKAFEKLGIMLEGTTFNIDFNETYIMDRTQEMVNELSEVFLEELNKTKGEEK